MLSTHDLEQIISVVFVCMISSEVLSCLWMLLWFLNGGISSKPSTTLLLSTPPSLSLALRVERYSEETGVCVTNLTKA